MIGQQRLKDKFIKLYTENVLPKVNILIAPKGYGKKEFVKWLSENINIPYKLFKNNVDDIREAITLSQNQYTNQLYIFENIEQNRITQNASLKLLEEPPQNTFIFLLCEDKNLLLNTILNRGIISEFEKYSNEELKQFNTNELALNIFNCPQDLINSKEIDIENLINTTNKIIDKLDLATISNALKLNSYIKNKDNKEGYDLDLFIKSLRYSFFIKYKNNKDEKILNKFNIFQEALKQVKLNNKYFMDTFILSNYKEVMKWK